MSSNTQTFIELAIEGGWKHVISGGHFKGGVFKPTTYEEVERWFEKHPQLILLDPLAWQAVGKSRGILQGGNWEVSTPCPDGKEGCLVFHYRSVWPEKWHHFIDLLAEGKNIEEALGEILK